MVLAVKVCKFACAGKEYKLKTSCNGRIFCGGKSKVLPNGGQK
jgi:hypothetical protein